MERELREAGRKSSTDWGRWRNTGRWMWVFDWREHCLYLWLGKVSIRSKFTFVGSIFDERGWINLAKGVVWEVLSLPICNNGVKWSFVNADRLEDFHKKYMKVCKIILFHPPGRYCNDISRLIIWVCSVCRAVSCLYIVKEWQFCNASRKQTKTDGRTRWLHYLDELRLWILVKEAWHSSCFSLVHLQLGKTQRFSHTPEAHSSWHTVTFLVSNVRNCISVSVSFCFCQWEKKKKSRKRGDVVLYWLFLMWKITLQHLGNSVFVWASKKQNKNTVLR